MLQAGVHLPRSVISALHMFWAYLDDYACTRHQGPLEAVGNAQGTRVCLLNCFAKIVLLV